MFIVVFLGADVPGRFSARNGCNGTALLLY